MAGEALGVLMRWTHISSVVVAIGGIIYARLVVTPAMEALAPERQSAMAQRLAERFRPWIYAAIAGLVISGLYNLLSHPGRSPRYHIWFGIKMLLVLHVFAVAHLLVKPAVTGPQAAAHRARRMSGILMSGLIIVLISAYLRWISSAVR